MAGTVMGLIHCLPLVFSNSAADLICYFLNINGNSTWDRIFLCLLAALFAVPFLPEAVFDYEVYRASECALCKCIKKRKFVKANENN